MVTWCFVRDLPSSWKALETPERSLELVVDLLSNGNLVLYLKNHRDYLWQSFDYPTDTLLPGMQLISPRKPNYGSRQYLANWRADNDPGKGDYIFGLDGDKFPRLIIFRGESVSISYRSGGWNGIKFADVPMFFNSTSGTSEDGAAFVYQNSDRYSRVTLTPEGSLRWLTWDQPSEKWKLLWDAPSNYCDLYNSCGANSYCKAKTCNCIRGFKPRELGNVTSGCVRDTQLSCSTDQFFRLVKMKLPDKMDARQYSKEGLKSCEDTCRRECDCTAYTIIIYQNGTLSTTCVTWSGDLLDVQNYDDAGQDLYIRVKGKKKNKSGLIIGLSVGAAAVIIIGISLLCCFWRSKQKLARANATQELQGQGHTLGVAMTEDPQLSHILGETTDLPPMDFGAILIATESFSHEIGHGGFGKVYKGRLPGGQEIAVKKLSEISTQGAAEFKNEVMLIANLQHINLVKLLGWSVHENERVLIYEFLENGNLQHHLFGRGQRSSELNWVRRFEIIKGIVQGLVYMQEGSRVMIIHRDLKPANILLDRDMLPKISDFGLARIFQRSENEVQTTNAAGTQGYMSPEYVVSGIYSTKSDIFSFRVMLLEIVTGKENRVFSYSECSTNLLTYIWTNWNDGNWEDIVDQVIRDSSPFPRQQVLRGLEIGLLCVQEAAENTQETVWMMLVNEAVEIPQPKVPGFFTVDVQNEIASTSNTYVSTSITRGYSTSDVIVSPR